MTTTNIQLTSTISADNKLTVALNNVAMPQPGADSVVAPTVSTYAPMCKVV